jgi:hypothetical protein
MSLQQTMNWNFAECRELALQDRLARAANGGVPAINARLDELENEWSAGRAAKSILAVCILAGTILTLTAGWWWIILPIAAGLNLLEYLFTRSSVLVGLLQRLGFRTRSCIEQEKFALRTLRGDFRTLPTILDIEDAEDISRLEGEGGLVVEDEERKVDSKDAVKEVLEAAHAG